MSPTRLRGGSGLPKSATCIPVLYSLGKSLQLQDLRLSWQPHDPSLLTLHPTKDVQGSGSPGHPLCASSSCPFLSPCHACPGRSSISSRPVSLIQFPRAPYEGTLSCPPSDPPETRMDGPARSRALTLAGQPSARLAPALGSGSWLASVSRPGGRAAGPGRRTGPLPLSARSRCLGNAAPPSRDPSVGPAADHVT